MATQLLKKVVRESTEIIDEKEIVITLLPNQKIELKLKGARGKGKMISIGDLYNQLYNLEGVAIEASEKVRDSGPVSVSSVKSNNVGDRKMISLYDLRSQNAISMLDLDVKCKFDTIIKNVIDSYKVKVY